jgi:hypothetical protein
MYSGKVFLKKSYLSLFYVFSFSSCNKSINSSNMKKEDKNDQKIIFKNYIEEMFKFGESDKDNSEKIKNYKCGEGINIKLLEEFLCRILFRDLGIFFYSDLEEIKVLEHKTPLGQRRLAFSCKGKFSSKEIFGIYSITPECSEKFSFALAITNYPMAYTFFKQHINCEEFFTINIKFERQKYSYKESFKLEDENSELPELFKKTNKENIFLLENFRLELQKLLISNILVQLTPEPEKIDDDLIDGASKMCCEEEKLSRKSLGFIISNPSFLELLEQKLLEQKLLEQKLLEQELLEQEKKRKLMLIKNLI